MTAKINQLQDVVFLVHSFANEYVVGLKDGFNLDGTQRVKRVIVDEREFKQLQQIYNKQLESMEREIEATSEVRGFSWNGHVKELKKNDAH